MKAIHRVLALLALSASLVAAQHGPGDRGRGFSGPGRQGDFGPVRPDGKWWADPGWIGRLGLSAEQQRRLEDVFQKSRLKLIDLRANLEKQEAILEPLTSAEDAQEARVFAQIDHIAEARAELEKANARMLWRFRQQLTGDQWKMIQAPASFGGRFPGGRFPGGRGND